MRRRTQNERISNPPRGLSAQNAWRLAAGEEPQLAAHLVSPRRLYAHHGLYVGSGRVIHYSGLASGLARGPVEEVSLERFARGREVWVSSTTRRFDSAVVIDRARARLGEDSYRLLSNNCEHFCEWCLRGESRSAQVESIRRRWRRVLSIVRKAALPIGRYAPTRAAAEAFCRIKETQQ